MTITQLAQAIETQGTDMAKIGPKEAALQAQRTDLSIPAALDRTKGMSKADFDELHEKLGKPSNRVLQHAKDVAYRKAIKAAKPGTLTEADKKAIAEIKKSEKAKAEAKKAADAAKRKEDAAEKKAVKDAAKKAKATSNPATDAEIAEADRILTRSPKKAKATSAPQKPAGKPKPSPAPETAPKAKPASKVLKGTTIASVTVGAIMAGKTNEEALAIVQSKFPGRSSIGNVRWYRGKLKRDGAKVPEPKARPTKS